MTPRITSMACRAGALRKTELLWMPSSRAITGRAQTRAAPLSEPRHAVSEAFESKSKITELRTRLQVQSFSTISICLCISVVIDRAIGAVIDGAITRSNFRNDINASDSITTGDVNIIKQNALSQLPSIP